MNKKKIWLFVLPVFILAHLFLLVSLFNEFGNLKNPILRERVFRVGQYISGSFTDLKFLFRGPTPPKNKIIIVEIDDESLGVLGRWPWSRDLTAYLIGRLLQGSPKVVGLDIFFPEKEERIPEGLKEILIQNKLGFLIDEFESDPKLAKLIEKFKDKIVLGSGSDSYCSPLYSGKEICTEESRFALKEELVPFEKFRIKNIDSGKLNFSETPFLSYLSLNQNIPEFQSSALFTGALNAPKDSDSVIRKSPLFFLGEKNAYPVIGLEMARAGLGEDVKIELNSKGMLESFEFTPSMKKIPLAPHGRMEMNFRGPADSFVYVSAYEVLSDDATLRIWPGRQYELKKVPFECHTCAIEKNEANQEYLVASKDEIFKDAYVLIGISALGANDIRSYPFDRHVPGVEGHATILDNLLSGDPIKGVTHGIWGGVLLGISILGGCLLTFFLISFGSLGSVVLVLGSLFILFIFDFIFLFSKNINLDTVWIYLEFSGIFLVVFAIKYFAEEKDKKFLKGAFSKYVAPAVVDAIVKDPSRLSLGGEKKELTILFSDIRSFTTLSEKMDAKLLAQFLNDYLGKMTEIVFAHKGTLDKFIGDALMAFWGAPVDVSDHSYQCAQAAISMQKKIREDLKFYMDKYGIEVHVGVGFHTGTVNVGNMGSQDNFNFTVIGDDVNLASRLEGLTKEYGVGILTSRASLDHIHKSGKPPPMHRVLDLVKVKGKNKAVEIIEICFEEYGPEFMSLFKEARALYLAKSWDESILKFQKAQTLFRQKYNRDDVASMRFIEICDYFKKNPPDADWDGSWQMTSK